MSLSLDNLANHYPPDLAQAILDLVAAGEIDRPRVSQGEQYIYIDTRIIKAPYGVISQAEVKQGCEHRLGGTSWAVYLYLLTCCSGRISIKGTEIGGKQIMSATGFSKASIYRACDQLQKAGLIKPSTRSKNRRSWLLCNPNSDAILDQINDEELQDVKREKDIQKEVSIHNSSLSITHDLPVNNPVNNSRYETEKSDTVIRSATNTNYSKDPHVYTGGEIAVNKKYKDQNEELLTPYLDTFFELQWTLLRSENSQDYQKTLEVLSDEYQELYSRNESVGDLHQKQKEIDRHRNSNQYFILDIWLNCSRLIADDLLNRRKSKTCILRTMGWSGTQSLNKIAEIIHNYAKRNIKKYV